jgi:hypothetical protein
MFERYTEPARRVIFFARYEASQLGSSYIETEHLLLGLLRQDKQLANRFLGSYDAFDSVRKQIEGGGVVRERISTSVDMPFSQECKRVLVYAAEEAEGMNCHPIGVEHLLLGLMREEKCWAAVILFGRGLRLSSIREELRTSASASLRHKNRPVSTFALTAPEPRLNKANPSNPTGFHEGPAPDGNDPRITNPWLSRLVTCRNMTMAQFADSLPEIASGYIRSARVYDLTGLEGAWDFTLSFSPADMVRARDWAANAAESGSPPVPGLLHTISLVEALETQLGLKLEPRDS